MDSKMDGSSFLVKVKNTGESDSVRAGKRAYLHEMTVSNYDKHYMNNPVEYVPIRCKVEINESKIDYEENYIKMYKESGKYRTFNNLRSKLLRVKKEDSFEEEFGVSTEDLYMCSKDELPVKKRIIGWRVIMGRLFDLLGDTIEFNNLSDIREIVGREDFEEYNNYLRVKSSLDLFKRVRINLDSSDRLPISFITKDYINFERGLALVSFRLDSSNVIRSSVTGNFLNKFQTLLEDLSIKVVNYSSTRKFIIFNILCKNEEVDLVLEGFSTLYRKGEEYYKENNYNLDFSIEYNIGQEDREYDRYYLFSGDNFKEVKERFKRIEEGYLGFPVYI